MKKKAIIIGSGIGGIATAIRLAVKNYEVCVFERNTNPGGKLNILHCGNYRFDYGPSLFTMPHLVTELFELSQKKAEDYLTWHSIPLACKYFWEDKTIINAWTDNQKFIQEIEKQLGVNPLLVKNYLKHTHTLYQVNAPVFLERSLHKINSYLSTDLLAAGKYLPSSDIFKTMDKANRKRLSHPKLVQMFNRMATYNGSDPYKASGILNIIASLEHSYGVFFPRGGMYSITRGLVKLAEDLGVQFRYSDPVLEILYENKKVNGVKSHSGKHYASLVVSNMDISHTYKKLLPYASFPAKIKKQEPSSSALVFYWGIKKSFPSLSLHNILFSNNYPEEFHCLFEKLDIYHDPTLYINISSKENPEDAPEGHENWFVMVNAPHEAGQDWASIISKTRQNALNKIHRILNVSLEKFIEEEYILSPPEIESQTSSFKGSLYGSSSNSRLSAFLRHSNFSRKIKGLYFAGGSVHPGGGIPLCLQSAKIVSSMVTD